MTGKYVFIIVLIALFLLTPFLLQAEPPQGGKSCLWEIKTATGKIYMLGSIHLLKEDSYPLKQAIRDAYADAQVIAVEANMATPAAASAAMKMLQVGSYTGENSLKSDLPGDVYRKVEDNLKLIGLDIGMFQRYKPWLVAITLTQVKLMKLGFQPQYGIDMHFLTKAAADKKEIVELEGLEFQLNMLSGFTNEESKQFLTSTIDQMDKIESELQKLITAWTNGDLNNVENFFLKSMKENPSIKRKMLDDRNVKMVEKIQTYLGTGKNYLVIVGAAHFLGDMGIINLLEQKGIKAKQL